MFRDVLDHRAPAEPVERSPGRDPADAILLAFDGQSIGEHPRLIEVSDADQILGVRDRGLGDVAPARAVRFDDQQVGQ